MNDDLKPKLNIKQQIVEKIKSANQILIVAHNNPDGDALGSSLALKLALTKLSKKVDFAAAGHPDQNSHFLPGYDQITDKIQNSKEFIITLDTSRTQAPHKVKYKTEDNKIHLIITPETGQFLAEDLSYANAGPKYDLIISLDTPNLEYLNTVFNDNQELFNETPIINIDHHGDNDNFGELNFVNSESSSVAEIIASIIEALSPDQNLIDSDIATCLLTGILADTASFQNNNTTSKSLTIAAQMIAAGANHQTIIKNLFKSQSLSELKAWGKILTNLQIKPSLKLAWSKISLADLQEIGASPDETSGVIDALIKNLPDINIFVLLTQTDTFIKGSLRSLPSVNINPIAIELGGGGHNQASGFKLFDMTLADAEKLVLETIAKHILPISQANTTSDNSDQNPQQFNTSTPTTPAPAGEPTNTVEKDYTTDYHHRNLNDTAPVSPEIDPEELDFDPNAEPFDPTETPEEKEDEDEYNF